jgi:hypothetical protein
VQKERSSILLRLILILSFVSSALSPASADNPSLNLELAGHADGQIFLTWSDSYNSGSVSEYIFEYRSSSQNWTVDTSITGLSTAATFISTNGVDYSFRVTPVFTNVIGSSSNVVTARSSTTPEFSTMTGIWNLPNGGFGLQFQDSGDGGSPITAYHVYYSSNAIDYTIMKSVSSLELANSSIDVPMPAGAKLGDPAFFRIIPENRDGMKSSSVWATFDLERPWYDDVTHVSPYNIYSLDTHPSGNCSLTLLRGGVCDNTSQPTPQIVQGDLVSYLRGSTDWYKCFLTSLSWRYCQANGFIKKITSADRNPYPFVAGLVKYPLGAPTVSIAGHASQSLDILVETGEISGDSIAHIDCAYSDDDGLSWRSQWGGWPVAKIFGLVQGMDYKIRCRTFTGYYSEWSNVVSEYTSTTPTEPEIEFTNLTANSLVGLVSIGSDAYMSGGSLAALNSLQYSIDGVRWFEVSNSQDQLDGTYSFSMTDLVGDRTYRFRANLINRDGVGPWSKEISVLPSNVSVPGETLLQVISHSDSTVELSWVTGNDGGATISGYVLQYSSNGGASWITLQKKAAGRDSTVFSGLTLGTSYTFRVAALNPVGQGPFSSTVSETPSSVPEVTQLHVKSTSATTVTLGWTGVANGGVISRYKIQYLEPGSADNWILSSDGVDSATTAVVRGLSPGTNYKFRVSALNRDGQGPFATVFEKPSAIPIVSALTSSTLSETSVRLTWSTNSNGDTITNSLVEYSADNGNSWTEHTSILPITSSSVDITGLTKSTTYQFRVSALNRDGWSQLSNTSIGSTFVYTSPSAPILRVVSHSSNSISLSWTTEDNGGKALNGYVLQYGKTSGDTWTSISSSGLASNSRVVTGLIQGQNYRFRVAVSNQVGQSQYSEIVFEKPSSPPSMFALSTQSSTDSSVGLIWGGGNPNGDPIKDYIVEFSIDGGSSWVNFEDGLSTRNSTIVTGLTRGTTYLFRVSAENRDGVGLPIPAISASTSPSTQPASTKLKISGVYKSGSIITVSVVGSLVGSKVTYEWLLDGKRISGRTTNKLTIPKSYIGRKLSIRVAIAVPRYWPRTLTSSATTVKK